MEDSPSLPKSSQAKKKPSLLKKVRDFFHAYKPLILSHHPTCDKFNDHVFMIRGRKLCAGCFTTIPAALVTITIMAIISFFYPISFLLAIEAGGILATITFLISSFLPSKYKYLKACFKIMVGVGFGVLSFGVLIMPAPLWLNVLVLMFMQQGITILWNVKRGLETTRICNKCEFKHDWKNCPGMSEVTRMAEKIGYLEE